MSEAWRLELGDGLRRLSGGGLMAREWVRALMARIEYCDHRIKAWVAVDRSAALAAAEAIDAGRAAGRAPGLLAGAPIGVKDLIAVEGLAAPSRNACLRSGIPCRRHRYRRCPKTPSRPRVGKFGGAPMAAYNAT